MSSSLVLSSSQDEDPFAGDFGHRTVNTVEALEREVPVASLAGSFRVLEEGECYRLVSRLVSRAKDELHWFIVLGAQNKQEHLDTFLERIKEVAGLEIEDLDVNAELKSMQFEAVASMMAVYFREAEKAPVDDKLGHFQAELFCFKQFERFEDYRGEGCLATEQAKRDILFCFERI